MMTFEERKARALVEVTAFLARMSPPRGMTEDAQDAVMVSIADALARKLPVGTEAQFGEDLEKTFANVSDNHKTWAWPSQGEFVAGIPSRTRSMAPAPETFSPASPHEAMARRMIAGGPVPESYIWGRAAQQMLNAGDVPRDVMDKYRRSSIRGHRTLYGEATEGIFTKRYGEVVIPYFRTSEAQDATVF